MILAPRAARGERCAGAFFRTQAADRRRAKARGTGEWRRICIQRESVSRYASEAFHMLLRERAMAKTILMIGAFDTKGEEYAFLREQIVARGHRVMAVN